MEGRNIQQWSNRITQDLFPMNLINVEREGSHITLMQSNQRYHIITHMQGWRMQGLARIYNEEGIEIARIIFLNGIANGPCILNDNAGKMYFKGRLEDGYRQGRGKEYDELGEMIFDGFYDKGKRLDNIVPSKEMNGYWKEYDEHGKLVSITQRDDFGRKEGICYFYDEEGEITRISEWKEDREISTSGYYELYDENKNDWFKGYFYKEKKLRSIPISERKRYYKEYNEENMLVRICGKDKEGRYQGICYFYNTEGLINRISFWEHGTEIRLIKQFNGSTMIEYNDGQKCYEGGYLESYELDYPRNGDGEEYGADGKTLLFKGSYNNGRKHGKGKSYKNNEIKRKTVWLAGYSKEGLLFWV